MSTYPHQSATIDQKLMQITYKYVRIVCIDGIKKAQKICWGCAARAHIHTSAALVDAYKIEGGFFLLLFFLCLSLFLQNCEFQNCMCVCVCFFSSSSSSVWRLAG